MITNIRFLIIDKVSPSYKRKWEDTVIEYIKGLPTLINKRNIR